MSSQSYVKKNFSLAWPLALNGLLMQSMLMIDTLLVSPLGEIPLAAIGIATTIVAAVLGIQMALANGTQLVLSRAVGANNQVSLNKGLCSGFFINGAIAVIFWVILTLFDRPLIALLTDDMNLHREIAEYLNISKYIILFTAITQVMIALFNGLGKTKVPFKGYLIELPINAILSYLLIHGYHLSAEINSVGLGVQGAAIGSVIAITVRMIYLGLYIHLDSDFTFTPPSNDSNMLANIRAHFIEIFLLLPM
ncbi:MATE family efflux transporter [Psychromonas sp. KJ10-2]|uniref:MATE family efflux transporter n=1 Tax=Psychromonas sp. KJ10-2 TaxID=3391822 RepID=UPI0039B4C469